VKPSIKDIADKQQKLEAWRLVRNTRKVQETMEHRSPFVSVVPSGRWIEKKERVQPVRLQLDHTPVRNVLKGEKNLKKSTIKDLMQGKSTNKKPATATVTAKQKATPKAKKKILAELNNLPSVEVDNINEVEQGPLSADLNSTFEVELPSPVKVLQKRHRRSQSVPVVAPEPVAQVEQPKSFTPPARIKAKVAVRVVKKVERPVQPTKKVAVVRKFTIKPATKKPISSKPVPLEAPPLAFNAANKPFVFTAQPAQSVKPVFSRTYQLYKSSMETQSKYLTIQLNSFTSNLETFIGLLSNDSQSKVHQTIQQGRKLVYEKLTKFGEHLDSFEACQKDPESRPLVTEDDVESYWILISEDIDKFKEDFIFIQEEKAKLLKVESSAKKRRTRNTLAVCDVTPRRSRRLAENVDTPK